ncbi:RagB/SusD family nutrient uptake outer membrane protein, partial [Dysgonomonas gadei]|uniref:RagB/SusD family nutrient uptake outer membrane protein n=1 Tax=Dysgonomonas gadei TaxID=156974 RepID=UPI003AEF8969
WSITGYLVKKHNQPLAEVPAGTKGDGGLPYIYLRYADILLMKAEAYTEANDLDMAAAALKLVRDRAGLAYTKPVNQEQMRSVIYLERRRELGFEFHRFFDLMRWGKDVATQALGSDFKWQEPRYYFPIPQNELDSNNGI